MVSPCHKLYRKRKKQVHDYYHKLIDDFNIIVVDPSPKLNYKEKRSIATSFGFSSIYQCI